MFFFVCVRVFVWNQFDPRKTKTYGILKRFFLFVSTNSCSAGTEMFIGKKNRSWRTRKKEVRANLQSSVCACYNDIKRARETHRMIRWTWLLFFKKSKKSIIFSHRSPAGNLKKSTKSTKKLFLFFLWTPKECRFPEICPIFELKIACGFRKLEQKIKHKCKTSEKNPWEEQF